MKLHGYRIIFMKSQLDDPSLQALVDLMKMIDHTSKKLLRINDLVPESVDV